MPTDNILRMLSSAVQAMTVESNFQALSDGCSNEASSELLAGRSASMRWEVSLRQREVANSVGVQQLRRGGEPSAT